jgi:hypothetical protein
LGIPPDGLLLYSARVLWHSVCLVVLGGISAALLPENEQTFFYQEPIIQYYLQLNRSFLLPNSEDG